MNDIEDILNPYISNKDCIVCMERLSKVKQYCMICEHYLGQFIIDYQINEVGLSAPGALWEERRLGPRKSL